MSEVEKVKEIIQKDLEAEAARSTSLLKEEMDRETQKAIDRINNVYTSALNALQKLEIADATLFDFFEKTQGNIRIYEGVAGHERASLTVEYFGFRLGYARGEPGLGYARGEPVVAPIELREGKKYKIIVMAMEEK